MALLAGFTACEVEDKNPVVEVGDKPVLVSPEEGTSYVLDPANLTNPAITVVWNHAKYSVSTEVNYNVEIALAGTEFAAPVSLQTTNARQISLSNEQFNAKVLEAGLIPFTAGSLDIRVKASLGTSNVMEVISNDITINITPFTTDLPKLWLPGSYQTDSGYGSDWTHSTAPNLAASAYGKTDFEGFVYFATTEVSPSDGFKFTDQENWSGGIFGDDGTFSGVITSPGDNIGVTPGYYYIKANTKPTTTNNPNGLSYSMTPTIWAITGSATPNGWPDPAPDHDMTYNPTTKKWEITIALSAGEFKFRANNGWSLNLGADNDGDDSMDFGGPNLTISTPGTYTVILDLSNPRKYTYSIQ